MGWLCNYKEEFDYEVAPHRTGPPFYKWEFLTNNWIERRKKAMFKRFTSALMELGIVKAMEHNVQPWLLFI